MSNKQFCCTLPTGARKKECGSSCQHCGWEAAEAARRRDYIKQRGLTLCADGLRRLIMKKEENEMATPWKECPNCGAHLDSGETCDCNKSTEKGDYNNAPINEQKEGNAQ